MLQVKVAIVTSNKTYNYSTQISLCIIVWPLSPLKEVNILFLFLCAPKDYRNRLPVFCEGEKNFAVSPNVILILHQNKVFCLFMNSFQCTSWEQIPQLNLFSLYYKVQSTTLIKCVRASSSGTGLTEAVVPTLRYWTMPTVSCSCASRIQLVQRLFWAVGGRKESI